MGKKQYLMAQEQKQQRENSSALVAKLQPQNRNTQQQTPKTSLFDRLTKRLGGKPSHLDYSLTLTNDNLSHSSLLRHASKHLLRSLLSNSVLPSLAAAGDTAQMIQDGQAQMDPATGQLVLKPPEDDKSDSFCKLTKLLSATSFDLREPPSFEKGGWLVLSSKAVLPEGEASLDFVLRTKPKTARQGSSLEFGSPEVRLDVGAVPLPAMGGLRKLLPKVVWVRVGTGVAVALKQLQRVGIANGALRLDGRWDVGPTKGAMVPRPNGWQ